MDWKKFLFHILGQLPTLIVESQVSQNETKKKERQKFFNSVTFPDLSSHGLVKISESDIVNENEHPVT